MRRHTRKGIRPGCVCEWCSKKRFANQEFYIDVLRRRGLITISPIPRPYISSFYEDWDDLKYKAVRAARHSIRTRLRAELYEIYPRPDYNPAY